MDTATFSLEVSRPGGGGQETVSLEVSFRGVRLGGDLVPVDRFVVERTKVLLFASQSTRFSPLVEPLSLDGVAALSDALSAAVRLGERGDGDVPEALQRIVARNPRGAPRADGGDLRRGSRSEDDEK
jgi:hypothetical protein